MRTILLVAVAALAACSSQPQSTEPQKAAAAQADPAAAVPAAKAASGSTQASAAAKKKEEFKIPSGYRTESRDGQEVYCRGETVIGSRFPTKVCYTLTDLKDMEARKKSIQEDVARRQRMCTGGSGCVSN